MLDALRTAGDDILPERLSPEEVADVVRELELRSTPANRLAVGWALARYELDVGFPVVGDC